MHAVKSSVTCISHFIHANGQKCTSAMAIWSWLLQTTSYLSILKVIAGTQAMKWNKLKTPT